MLLGRSDLARARGRVERGPIMHETDKRARIAGAVYLLSAIPLVFSAMYVQHALVAPGDPAASISRIVASETLFRWGMAAELLAFASWVFVPLALYRLLAAVDRGQAALMVVLGLMTVPIMFVNVLSELAVLTMLHDPGFSAAFSPAQLQALVGLSLRTHAQGSIVAAVFWGLWLFPFAVLVWRSGFLPKLLAILLAIGGLGYLASSVTAILAPSYGPVIGPVVLIAISLGELPIIFWLLLAGARPRRPAAPAAGPVPVPGQV
jgi:hypothetical protein